jgi:hypothetical protein
VSVTVSADDLLEAVMADVGLDDFGDDRYVGEYRRAVDAVNAEVELTEAGLPVLEEWITRTLTNVLRMQRDLAEHPEIREEVLAPPIVITGFARTGTTKLQRITSACPATQSLSVWKLFNPAPFPDADPADPDPRIAVAQAAVQMMEQGMPEFWAAHSMPALDVDEDMAFHDMTFISPTAGMRHGAWDFMNAQTPIDRRVFDFLRTTLQYLQWQDGSPDRVSRPWILKSPIHIGNIATFRDVFGDAKYVFCHREVESVMASLCSLVDLSIRMVAEPPDRAAIGTALLDYWSAEWERGLKQRAELDPDSYIDLRFDSITGDGVRAAERVHELAGLTFDDAAGTASAEWEAANPRHSGGKHEYRLSDYGLTTERVRDAFSAYYAYFGESEVVA